MKKARLTAFRWVPPFAQGLVRDLPVRWALEEAGVPYEERLIAIAEKNSPSHRALQPFGQVPAYEEDDLALFESGAIVMHIAEACPVLLPGDPARRARVRTWMFAALNSVEPHVQNLVTIDLFHSGENWAKARRPAAEELARSRLEGLSASLSGRDWLERDFSAGDLLMVCILRFLRHTTLVSGNPVLSDYQQRAEARPAFQRALASQMEPFERHAPAA